MFVQVGLYEATQIAASTVVEPTNIVFILVATVFGLVMGAIPGLGGIVAITLLIPLTYGLDPIVAFMILSAVLGGTNFGGSMTAILLNTPGQSTNAATLLDGYPMTRQGRAGEAIGASAAASVLGALFGIVVLLASIPIMAELVLLISQPEIFWLGIWGITVIAVVVRGAVVTGLVSGCIGFLLTMHGTSHITAGLRWTYGSVSLEGGIGLIPVLIGLFAVGEMINLVSEGTTIAQEETENVGGNKWKGVWAVWTHRRLLLRSAIIGVLLGMVPGVGGATANFVAYFQAMQTSDEPDKFGTGTIEGVIAAEAGNDAKDGGGYIPTLALGIPGSAAMAVLLGAFTLHGIIPGPLFFEQNLDIVMMIILALLLSNVLTSSIGVLLTEKLAQVTKVDIHVIAPIVIAVSFLGAYTINSSIFDVFVTFLFGIFGFVMILIGMSRVPLVLAMVLAPIIEVNYFRSLQISGGDPAVFVRSPIAIFLILLVILSLLSPFVSWEKLINTRLDEVRK